MKKALSFLLTIVLTFSILPLQKITFFAEEQEDFTYLVLDDGTAEISRYNGSDENVDVPAEIDGYLVSSIGVKAFYNRVSVISVTLPEGITKICNQAFLNCVALESVHIPTTLSTSEYTAFGNTPQLKNVYITDLDAWLGISFDGSDMMSNPLYNNGNLYLNGGLVEILTVPETITTVNAYAFAGCGSLTRVNIHSEVTRVSSLSFIGCHALTEFYVDATNAYLASISGVLYRKYNSDQFELTAYPTGNPQEIFSVPSGLNVNQISSYAFYDCDNLKSISISENINTISNNTFNHCDLLEEVQLPESVKYIGAYAFSDCTSLKNINLVDNITEIAFNAFRDCANLETLVLPANLNSIGDYAFMYCTGLQSVVFNEKINAVGLDAFYGCTSLLSINLPNSLTKLGQSAFSGCTSAKTLVIGSGLSEIPQRAFWQCTSLEAVTISEGVTKINDSAFSGCNALLEIIIPNTVTEIGSLAFNNCTLLRSVVLSQNLKTIKNGAFAFCESLEQIFIPASVEEVQFAFSHNHSLQSYTVDENNLYYSSQDGVLFNKDKTVLYKYPSGATQTEYTVPSSVIELGSNSFFEADELTSITIMDTVTVVSESAGFRDRWSHDAVTTNLTIYGIPGSAIENYCENQNNDLLVFVPLHWYSDWIYEITPTCVSDSVGYRVCSDCGNTEYRNFPALGHSYAPEWTIDTPATCITDGVKSHHCVRCDSVDSVTDIPATGHTYSDIWTVDVQATCTTDGIKSHHCINCSDKIDESVIYALGHSYGAWTIVKEATCTESGTKSHSCESCGYAETQPIEALGHDFLAAYSIDSPATCTADGEKSRHCSRCVARTDITVIPGGIHFYSAWSVTKEPTCTTDGEMTRKCELCDTEEIDIMPALGHSYTTNWIIDTPATCTETGIKSHHCTRCDAKKDVSKISATGHSYGNWIIDTQATCTDNGVKHKICESCGNTICEDIPATGHIYATRWTIDKEATCLEVGEKSHYCLYCDDRTDITVIPVCGHVFGPWYIETESTMDAEGTKAHNCYNCDFVERTEIPKLGKYTATFVADGEIVAIVSFPEGAKELTDVPPVPKKNHYVGKWEAYTLSDRNLTVYAEYTKIQSDDLDAIGTDSNADYYASSGEVEIQISASSPGKNIITSSSTSVPLDIVLVLDQSGSMEGVKKTALLSAVQQFSNTVLNDAISNGVDHRMALVGFAMGSDDFGKIGTSNYIPRYKNTNILTTGGTPVSYEDATPNDYAAALVPVCSDGMLNPTITTAMNNISAQGATMANLGLEMASSIFANTNSEKRQRIVVFLTDGEPTSGSDFEFGVANSALQNAYQLKNTYNATVYSIGIFDDGIANENNINNFMNYVSSNYMEKHTLNSHRTETTNNTFGYYLTVEDTSALSEVFSTIATESIESTSEFDNATIVYTLSQYFSLTIPQETALRQNAVANLGVCDSDITVTRRENGTTKIEIANIHPVFREDIYVIDLTFRATANANTKNSGSYAVNTLDSGVLLTDNSEYENVFAVQNVDITGTSGIATFTINGIPYAIDRLKSTDFVIAPAVDDFNDSYIFSGWEIPENTKLNNACATYEATLTKYEYCIKWNIDGVLTTQYYAVGDVIQVPVVTEDATGGEFIGWDIEVPYTMPAQDLTINALYNAHYHNYIVTKEFENCSVGGKVHYECACGDYYEEELPPCEHTWEAITGPLANNNSAHVGFRCSVCGVQCNNHLEYEKKGTTANGNNSNRQVEFDLSYQNTQTGNNEQPGQYVNISVPLDACFGEAVTNGAYVKVYRINDDGTKQLINSSNDGAYVQFETNHFSTYVFELCGNKTEADCDLTGDGILTQSDYALLVLYAVGAIQFEDWQLVAGDINDDGAVDAFDAADLNLYLSGAKVW